MAESRHIIRQQVLELFLESDKGARDIQEEISDIFKSRVMPRMEQLFDQLSEEGRVLKIDTLDLNLGEISWIYLKDEFPLKVEQLLEQEITKLIYQQQERIHSDTHAISISWEDSKLEAFQHLLASGNHSWNNAFKGQSLSQLFQDLVTNKAPQVKAILVSELGHEYVRKRIVYQLSESQYEVLLALLSDKLNQETASIFQGLQLLGKQLPSLSIHEQTWNGQVKETLLQSITHQGKTSVTTLALVQQTFSNLLTAWNGFVRRNSGIESSNRDNLVGLIYDALTCSQEVKSAFGVVYEPLLKMVEQTYERLPKNHENSSGPAIGESKKSFKESYLSDYQNVNDDEASEIEGGFEGNSSVEDPSFAEDTNSEKRGFEISVECDSKEVISQLEAEPESTKSKTNQEHKDVPKGKGLPRQFLKDKSNSERSPESKINRNKSSDLSAEEYPDYVEYHKTVDESDTAFTTNGETEKENREVAFDSSLEGVDNTRNSDATMFTDTAESGTGESLSSHEYTRPENANANSYPSVNNALEKVDSIPAVDDSISAKDKVRKMGQEDEGKADDPSSESSHKPFPVSDQEKKIVHQSVNEHARKQMHLKDSDKLSDADHSEEVNLSVNSRDNSNLVETASGAKEDVMDPREAEAMDKRIHEFDRSSEAGDSFDRGASSDKQSMDELPEQEETDLNRKAKEADGQQVNPKRNTHSSEETVRGSQSEKGTKALKDQEQSEAIVTDQTTVDGPLADEGEETEVSILTEQRPEQLVKDQRSTSSAQSEKKEHKEADGLTEGHASKENTTFDKGDLTGGEGISRDVETPPLGKMVPHPEDRFVAPIWRKPPAIIEEVHINNAGLALLWPYLPILFKGLNWVKDGAFVAEEYQFRAIHFLQFMATGEVATEEQELAFNKLLVGLQPEMPVPYDVSLTNEELEEAEHLLKTVLESWKALKSGSIALLRQTFLQKEGLMKKDMASWKLYVERSAFDILLDRLPWSYSVVKLPWMDNLINVEW